MIEIFETHKKHYSTLAMPWHDDDHKFGESLEPRIVTVGSNNVVIGPYIATDAYSPPHTVSFCQYPWR